MATNVEVWNNGDLQVTGSLVQIVAGYNGNITVIVQDSEGWLTTWPVQSVKVLPDPPAPVVSP